MVGWECPDCGDTQVCSQFEFRRIYNYHRIAKDDARTLFTGLQSRGVTLQYQETDDGEDVVNRYATCIQWAQQDRPTDQSDTSWLSVIDGPGYICGSCHHPWTGQEVPR
jgi:hypothetical protein